MFTSGFRPGLKNVAYLSALVVDDYQPENNSAMDWQNLSRTSWLNLAAIWSVVYDQWCSLDASVWNIDVLGTPPKLVGIVLS